MIRLGLAALLALPLAQEELPLDPHDVIVHVEEVDGEHWCTVVVEDVSVHRVLTALTAQMGYELEGFESVQRSALVTVHLRRRPVQQVLEAVLGSVGLQPRLRTGTLQVVEETLDDASSTELLARAAAAYARAHSRFPDHPLAIEAHLSQGELEQSRGNYSAALSHYLTVADEYRTSPCLPEALLRAGSMLIELGRWSDASAQFRELLNLSLPHSLHSRARLALARCLLATENPGAALHMLNILDEGDPPQDLETRRARGVVRAEALIASGLWVDALRLLERIEGVGLEGEPRLAIHRLRALAFEGLEMTEEAARAWLIYGSDASGAAREGALERSMQLALEMEDELGVLFAYEQVDEPELRQQLARYAREARQRLGLPLDPDLELLSVKEKLDLAESWLAADEAAQARDLTDALFRARTELEPDDRVRLALVRALCLEATESVDAAVAVLREERATLARVEDRTRLDRRAAQLFERRSMFDRAVAAYEGRY